MSKIKMHHAVGAKNCGATVRRIERISEYGSF